MIQTFRKETFKILRTEVNYFRFAFFNTLAENINNRETEKLRTFPAPLNATNLQERPVCLKKIISFHHSYSHSFFQSLKKNFYSTENKLYSTFDSLESTVDWYNLVVDSYSHFVEYLKKGTNMQTFVYKGLLSSVDSTKLNENSTRLNKNQRVDINTQQNYAVWARQFIETHKLKRGQCKNLLEFKKLPKSKKQAIYYQLRKTQRLNTGLCKEINNLQKLPKSIKKREVLTKSKLLRESTKLVLFLIIEAAILKFSHDFYLKLGLSVIWAWAFAFMVEAAYTILSSENKLELKVLRTAIFLFSAFTVCYSSFINDSALQKNLSWRDEKILNQSAQVKALENMRTRELGQRTLAHKSAVQKIKTINLQIDQLEKRMNYYKRVGNETSLKLLSIEKYKKLNQRAELQSFKALGTDGKISSLDSKIEASRLKLASLKSKHSQSKILSWSNFKALEINTYVWMSLMLILQLVSSSFIKSICSTINAYINQKHKKKRKRNFDGYSSSYLSA